MAPEGKPASSVFSLPQTAIPLPQLSLPPSGTPVLTGRFDELLGALRVEYEQATRSFSHERFQSLINELMEMQQMIRDLEAAHARSKRNYESQIAALNMQLRELRQQDDTKEASPVQPPDIAKSIAAFAKGSPRAPFAQAQFPQKLSPMRSPNITVTTRRLGELSPSARGRASEPLRENGSFALSGVPCSMSFGFSDPSVLAIASKSHCFLWDCRASALTSLPEPEDINREDVYYRSIAFSPDDSVIAAGSEDHSITLWRDRQFLRRLAGHGGDVYAVVFLSSDLLISASGDGTIRRWSVHDGSFEVLVTLSAGFTCLTLSHDRLLLAAGIIDRSIMVWHVQGQGVSLTPMATLTNCHSDVVYCVDFSPRDSNVLVSGSLDNTLKLWNVREEKAVCTLIGHEDFVLAAGFTPDSTRVISCSKDQRVHVWEVANKRTLSPTLVFPLFAASGILSTVHALVTSLAISQQMLATGCGDSTIRLWSLK